MMNKDDLISRAAAIEAINRAAYWNDAERKITELPAVDAVEVVHGRWITKQRHEHYPSGKPYGADYCSVCGKRGSIEYPYCPNCGAKMDGRESDGAD